MHSRRNSCPEQSNQQPQKLKYSYIIMKNRRKHAITTSKANTQEQQLNLATPAPISPKKYCKPRRYHSAFIPTLSHLSRTLWPLVSVTTGNPHSAFPKSLLQYHLLPSTDLDQIAAHYHQTIPSSRWTSEYPRRIPAWVDKNGIPVLDIPVETKRRRIGRFIGLRGCESPNSDGMLQALDREWEEALNKREERRDGWFGKNGI
ncbi:hypothetical protein FQN57_006119 [Myotisia sp. PD_48]|nr:hypothetical protein FQN57_006119 [Myotisia sp. PD_48]